MTIALFWSGEAFARIEPDRVRRRLRELFRPFSLDLAEGIELGQARAHLSCLHAPVKGWDAPFFQEDELTSALTLDYPFNAGRVLAKNHVQHSDRDLLPALCRALQDDAPRFLKDLSPHFSLIWFDRRTHDAFIQHDGLGFHQLFEYSGNGLRAFTNHLSAFKALGIELEPVRQEWALRCVAGFFPNATTGFRNVSYVEPGIQYRFGADGGVHIERHDVLREWTVRPRASLEENLELAYEAIHEEIRAAKPYITEHISDLTGGYDSRAIVAAFMKEGIALSLRVRGKPGNYDVILARRLAQAAGLQLKVHEKAGEPHDSPERIATSLRDAVLWQGGAMEFDAHKMFNYGEQPGGRLSIKGNHGEILRSAFSDHIKVQKLRPDQYRDSAMRQLFQRRLEAVREDLRDDVVAIFNTAYDECRRMHADELDALDYFNLLEWRRRSTSARCHYVRPGLTFAPYLNADCIRAAFATAGEKRLEKPFHRYILERDLPAWAGIPYAGELHASDQKRQKAVSPLTRAFRKLGNSLQKRLWGRTDWRHATGKTNYNAAAYWLAVGKPVADEARAHPGFWSEVLDPAFLDRNELKMRDELVVLHYVEKVLT